jgi:hypothetical protein
LKKKTIISLIGVVSLILGVSCAILQSKPVLGFNDNTLTLKAEKVKFVEEVKIPEKKETSIKKVKSIKEKDKLNEDFYTWYTLDKMKFTEGEMRTAMYSFLSKYKKAHLNDKYISNLVDYYVKLLDNDTSNVQLMLYFVALCSVESNFEQNVPVKYGAGISQVVYRVHKKYIRELGVSKNNFYKSPEHNIYVGYKIFFSYWKNSDKLYKKAAARYNGNTVKGYSTKVHKRYLDLIYTLRAEIKTRNKSS